MKGVILAGGQGTRLFPLTEVTNKHLVPVGAFPMIEYPLNTLINLGVEDISVVTGGEHFSDVARYLSSLHPEINFSYYCQHKPGGIAQALSLVKPSVENQKIAVVLGDNVFEENFYQVAQKFKKSPSGATIFLKGVENPERFGVAYLRGGKIIDIKEKPQNSTSNLATTGLYLYDETIFEKIKKLKPSKRGEYEITDVNNAYLKEGNLDFHVLDSFWSDAGTVESRKHCEEFVKQGLETEIFNSLRSNPNIEKKLIEAFNKRV